MVFSDGQDDPTANLDAVELFVFQELLVPSQQQM